MLASAVNAKMLKFNILSGQNRPTGENGRSKLPEDVQEFHNFNFDRSTQKFRILYRSD